jgi:hypothetical protein
MPAASISVPGPNSGPGVQKLATCWEVAGEAQRGVAGDEALLAVAAWSSAYPKHCTILVTPLSFPHRRASPPIIHVPIFDSVEHER